MSTFDRTRPPSAAPSALAGFERVLELLASHHGIDARDYKLGTLRRRAARRMGLLGFSEWPMYATYLERHPEELIALYRDGLVRVTRFFRDPVQWEHLEQEIVPRLLRDHPDERKPIRVWSAGCATGEEACSLVMIFLEQLERSGRSTPLQVFATDVSQDAVVVARKGLYPKTIARDVPPERLARFFSEHRDGYQVTREIRERVTIGYHDVLSDPPFSWLDLVACRNLLIYLEPYAQQECLRRFHFSLLPHGVLWLGNAEDIDRNDGLFRPLAPEHRMYERIESYRRGILPWSVRTLAGGPSMLPSSSVLADSSPSRVTRTVERFVLSHRTPACVVIDRGGRMVRLFGPTSQYLVHPQGDVRTELLAWVDPSLHVELRPALERAFEQSEVVVVDRAHVQRGDLVVPITCTVEPIPVVGDELWLVTFRDEPERMPTQATGEPDPPVPGADSLVQQLARELQVTKADLRNALDGIAGIEADHRAAHEELFSINEELQVSVDALASSKAEALSVNEELQTVNRELEERNARLHVLNADLENLLAVTTIPTIFLDRRLCVRRFAAAAPAVMRLTHQDEGRPLELIASRVAGERLLEAARHVLERLVPVEAAVRGEDGRSYLRRMVPYRSEGRVDGVCITFVDVTPPELPSGWSEPALRPAESDAPASGPLGPLGLLFMVLDHALRIVATSEAFRQVFAPVWREAEALPLSELGDGQWSSPALHARLDRVLRERDAAPEIELPLVVPGLGPRELRLRATPMASPGGTPLVLVSIEP